jgi:lipoprotein-releasing system permease protein
MQLPYEFLIGLRYLESSRRRGASLNTLISIGGVTVGVAALIATLAIMTGFSEDLRQKILGTTSHIVINGRTGVEISDHMPLLREIEKTPNVVAAAPFIFRQVLLASEASVLGVVLRGIDPEAEGRVTEIGRNMVEGKLSDLTRQGIPGIIIGRELSGRLGVFPGETLHLISPVGMTGGGIQSALGVTPKIRKFQVAGIFDSGMLEYDSSLAYISIQEAQAFFNLSDRITGIEVKVDDIFRAGQVAAQIQARMDSSYQARDWMQLNRNLFSALKMEKSMMFIILVLIVLVASFNIVSTLTMTVMEKSKEIAILKAMGASREAIMRIFMLEGVIIGVVGVLLGLPLGVAICLLLQRFYKLPGDVYYLSYLPVKIQSFDLILVACSAILIGFLATLYPSRRAAQLDPAEALRYE